MNRAGEWFIDVVFELWRCGLQNASDREIEIRFLARLRVLTSLLLVLQIQRNMKMQKKDVESLLFWKMAPACRFKLMKTLRKQFLL